MREAGNDNIVFVSKTNSKESINISVCDGRWIIVHMTSAEIPIMLNGTFVLTLFRRVLVSSPRGHDICTIQ